MLKHFFFAIIFIGVGGFLMGGACEDAASGACGECGTIANGDVTISGNAELDGLFKAVGDLNVSTGSIRSRFDARVRSLATNVFDIEVDGQSTEDLVVEIEDAFDAQIKGELDGGISVVYQAPKCSADINVSVSAQAQCEAKAGCDVDAKVECDPGQLAFECKGQCTGSCSAECTGSCTVSGEASASCDGDCSGSCELEGAVECKGTCKGTCNGNCSLENASGECEGECDGDCEGVCEMKAGGECKGTCHGECKFEADADVECEGTCEGSCDGECTGGCQGEFEPPSCDAKASADCDAQADCQAQASAQASANLSCSPPSIELSYGFKGNVDASARAAVGAKIEKLRVEMVAIVQGMTELRALVDADYAADLDIESPVATIEAAIEDFAEKVASGDFEITAVALLPCAGPAFKDAGKILSSLPGEMSATIEAQMSLAAMIGL